VRSVVLRTQSFSAIFCQTVFFYFTTCQVLNSIASCKLQEKRKVNKFNKQTCSDVKHRASCREIPVCWQVWNRPYEWNDCCNRCIGPQNNTATRSFLINNTFRPWANFLHQTLYCWSYKTLATIHWTISEWIVFALSFCPQKMNNRRLFLAGCFQWQRCHI